MMKIQKHPDYLIFAQDSKSGELLDFPDVSRGWGITIDQTASKPPMEWMNGAFNRIDKNMLYLLQQGVPEWSEQVFYPVNAIIKYNGIIYIAKVENESANPVNNVNKWTKLIPDASTEHKGIVQLSSAIDSESESQAATAGAVKKAYNLANTANKTANTANTTANTAKTMAETAKNIADAAAIAASIAQTSSNNANNNANGRVPSGRKINGKALTADIALTAGEVGAYTKAECDNKFNLKNTATAAYWKCGTTGKIFQWITILMNPMSGGEKTITFPISFPKKCYAVFPSVDGASPDPSLYTLYVRKITNTSCAVYTHGIGTKEISILAIGD